MTSTLSVKWRSGWRAVEAACALSITTALLRLVSFRLLINAVGRATTEPCSSENEHTVAIGVRTAIRRATIYLPWHGACLAQAIAGRVMLFRRRIPSTILLGVAKETDQIQAHAWLLAAGIPVCGGERAPDFNRIVSFGDHGIATEHQMTSHEKTAH